MKFTDAFDGLILIVQALGRDCFVANGRIHFKDLMQISVF